jgi:hypothetical protein
MKHYLIIIFSLSPYILGAQVETPVFKVNYERLNEGEESPSELSFIYHDQIVYLSQPDDKIQQYTDLQNGVNISVLNYEGSLYRNNTSFIDLPEPTYADKPEEILGYDCQYASFSYFSNKIEVWYTEKTEAKGTPYSRFLPNKNALALKIIINGNRKIIAKSIEQLEGEIIPEFLPNTADQVTDAEFEELKINSKFTKLMIFEDEQINFDPSLPVQNENELVENQTYHFSKGSVILKKINLSQDLRNSGFIFAKLHCRSNGDAYDRTGSVFIIPENEGISVLDAYLLGVDVLPIFNDNQGDEYQGIRKENDYEPPIELMRFFTSFGADHFNEKREINNYPWVEDVIYKQDVSALIPSEEAPIWIGVFIGNYDKGGHKVSLELDFYPSFDEEEKSADTKYIQPLFSTINTLEMSGQNYGRLFKNDTLAVEFEIEENIEDLQLVFTTTGHGGWGGGDEFNPKLNQILLDGTEIFSIVPWRTDCGTYRLSNPASGNFSNGMSSSDFSRSNWCPGTLTPPYIIPLMDIEPGMHRIQVVIDQGEDVEGGFSHWGVTGVIIGI